MRLSSNSEDRGYAAWKALPERVIPFVTVDDVEVRRAITADDQLGYVLAYELDGDGQVKLNTRKNSALKKQIRGKVVIELRRKP